MVYENDFNTFFEGGCFSYKEETEDMMRKVLERLDYLQGF